MDSMEYEIVEGNPKDWTTDDYGNSFHIKRCNMPDVQQSHLLIPNMIDGHFVDAVSGSTFSKCETRYTADFDPIEDIIPNTDIWTVRFADGIKNIGPAVFKHCTNLHRVDLPKGLEWIGEETFEGCTALKSIEIPSSVRKIEPYAFKNSGIKTLIIPGSVETIQYWSLSETNCESIILSEGVKKIDFEALMYNKELRSIVFPRSLTSIDESAFMPRSCVDDQFEREFYYRCYNPANITVFCYPATVGFLFAKTHGMKVENAGF